MVRLAVRLGMSSITVCGDSEVALAQVLSLRACSPLRHQQAILRLFARVSWTSSLVVRLLSVPSDLQPGDPMSRGNSEQEGLQSRPQDGASEILQCVLCHLDARKICGIICLRNR